MLVDRVVHVTWEDGCEGRFHSIWLKDNAADELSIDPHSRERTFDFLSLSLEITPDQVFIGSSGSLAIQWNDAPEPTLYHPGWLRKYCYDLDERDIQDYKIEYWNDSNRNELPLFDFSELVKSGRARLNWLFEIQSLGLGLLKIEPGQGDEFEAWLESLMVIRDMNWGKYYDVVYETDGEYIVNKGIEIPPHCDGPTREYMPGIMIFRCIQNTVQGGNSYWADAFQVAAHLRSEHPKAFKLLSTVPWAMADRHPETEYKQSKPLICLDRNNQIVEVRDTHWLREPLLADFDLIEPMYQAYHRYTQLVRDSEFQIHRRMEPGEVAIINNRRILHAREAYTEGDGHRHMRICYSEREELESAIAVLRRGV